MQIKKENSFVSKLSSFFHVILPESCINFATKSLAAKAKVAAFMVGHLANKLNPSSSVQKIKMSFFVPSHRK
jgi:hypothetical protein